ncbi:MAG TPA: NAD-dependent epimerase/dehydratase family protein [Pseudonocardia sp.]|nr:NAD-dependent epimerase/dehydratase family protein [Pseudonocardia sp.]
MLVLVTGGTGTSGRALVPALRAAGHDMRVLSRRPGPDRIELVAAGPAG